ncbi:hypothetical protein QQ045_005654 [Rhodiola kirilowii]
MDSQSTDSDKLISNNNSTTCDVDKSNKPQQQKQNHIFLLLSEPYQWLQLLSDKLNPTFILGVFLVYGLSQGFAGSYFKVVSDYYWKDVQKLQPSAVQLFMGFYYLPWIMKPVWGILTDVFPVRGYRRRPYFVAAGVVGFVSALTLALTGKLSVAVALGCMVGITAGVAIADVTIDACIARNSIQFGSLAADMQSLCGACSSAGALVGYSVSGFFVHHLRPQGALGVLAMPSALLIVLGFVIYEPRMSVPRLEQKRAVEKVSLAVGGMYRTVKYPQVWKPSLYMYLSLALSISTHEGQFYWYTDPIAGPAFSQEFVGIIYAIGALASMLGVLIYHKFLKDYPFRNLLFFAQLLYALSGMLDLVFILRWNISLGIPDSLFVICEQCVSHIVSRLRWMPMIVLSTKLCPLGIEGTFFALLMCIDSLGNLSSKGGGGVVLHVFHVTRTDFSNLWLAIFVRNLLRIATLSLIFLVPRGEQTDSFIPSDILTKNVVVVGKSVDDDSIQLVPVNQKLGV